MSRRGLTAARWPAYSDHVRAAARKSYANGGQLVTLTRVLLVVALAGSLIAHLIWGVSLGLAFLILFVGWPILGTLVTIDDDLPGGWSNPDGTRRADCLEAPFWGRIIVGAALSVIGFAIDAGWGSSAGMRLCLLAVCLGIVAAALTIRR